MIFGIEISELLNAFTQIGAAIVGGASFYGLYFLWKAGIDNRLEKQNNQIAMRLESLLHIGTIVFSVSYFIPIILSWLETANIVIAHEGISILRTKEILTMGQSVTLPFVLFFLLVNFIYYLFLQSYKKEGNEIFVGWLYVFNFFMMGVVTYLLNYTGALSQGQFFVGLHGVHSIWTIGSVTVVDFIYLTSLTKSDAYQQATYLAFPIITKFIWIGLVLDTISSLGLFTGHLTISPRFLFMQTVYALLIINGVFLVRKIGSCLTSQALKQSRISINPKLSFGAIFFGAISMVSWYTVTIVDFLEGLTLSYFTLLSIYFVVVALGVFFGHFFEERAEMK